MFTPKSSTNRIMPLVKSGGFIGKTALAIDHDRQARVGQRADQARPVLRRCADGFGQFVGPERAVHAEHVDFGIRLERRDERRRVGAGQHALAAVRSNDACTMIGRRRPTSAKTMFAAAMMHLMHEQVLLRFDQQHVHAAGQQAAHLLGIAVEHRVPVGVARARRAWCPGRSSRRHSAGDPAFRTCRTPAGRSPRRPCCSRRRARPCPLRP